MISKSELYFNSMKYSQIHLNDFETFDNFLFGVGERDWSTFLDDEGYFIPPITHPVSITQHQLCHYAYWMTIAKNDLTIKPRIRYGTYVPHSCYACKYASFFISDAKLCRFCPLVRDTSQHNCGIEYSHYLDCSYVKSYEVSEWAEKIAKMTWKNPKLDDISEPGSSDQNTNYN